MIRSIAVACLLASTPANSAFLFPCTPEDGRETIERALEAVERMTKPIEKVSPSDSEFYKTETEAAFRDQNEARFNTLVASPLYPAWQVWSATAGVKVPLEAARDATVPAERIIQLADALKGAIDLKDAMVAYRDHDARRPKPVVTEDRQLMFFDLAIIPSSAASAIQCTAAGLR